MLERLLHAVRDSSSHRCRCAVVILACQRAGFQFGTRSERVDDRQDLPSASRFSRFALQLMEAIRHLPVPVIAQEGSRIGHGRRLSALCSHLRFELSPPPQAAFRNARRQDRPFLLDAGRASVPLDAATKSSRNAAHRRAYFGRRKPERLRARQSIGRAGSSSEAETHRWAQELAERPADVIAALGKRIYYEQLAARFRGRRLFGSPAGHGRKRGFRQRQGRDAQAFLEKRRAVWGAGAADVPFRLFAKVCDLFFSWIPARGARARDGGPPPVVPCSAAGWYRTYSIRSEMIKQKRRTIQQRPSQILSAQQP